ncbi:MAG TPA: Dabb family protein [Chloroflexota bacterium]|nr:Dabb family protein [Chloroflexota bacterium]
MPTRHIVLVRVRPEVSPAEVEQAFAPLAALQGVIPGLLSFHGGPNTSPEGAGQGYNYGFVMDFADAAARDAYLPDPRHREAAAGLSLIREPGGVLVFDLDY